MKFDQFTEKSQEAIQAAIGIAATRRNPQVNANHLLLALLEDDGVTRSVLAHLGVDIDGVRRHANEAVDLLPTVTGDGAAQPQPDSEFMSVLERAEKEAKKRGDTFIAVHNLLLALADDRNTEVGATRDQIDAALKEMGTQQANSQNAEDTFQALERFGRDRDHVDALVALRLALLPAGARHQLVLPKSRSRGLPFMTFASSSTAASCSFDSELGTSTCSR
jgi:ATP-dependent Clp protease ATP-binding subunit ClpB